MAVLGRMDGREMPGLDELAGEDEPEPDEEDLAERQLEVTRMWNSVLRGVAAAHSQRAEAPDPATTCS